MPIGTQVFIWGRPEQNLILLFGEGVYEGVNHINGNNWPVIRLLNGQEYTIHYQGVWVGEKGAVERQCKQFKGDVLEFDLTEYLNGRRPTIDQRTKTAAVNGAVNLPEPKTATDRLLYLKREIDLEQSKIKLHEQAIAAATDLISKKRAEMAAIKGEVLKELSALDDVPPEVILAAAEKIRAQQALNEQPKREQKHEALLAADDAYKMATED